MISSNTPRRLRRWLPLLLVAAALAAKCLWPGPAVRAEAWFLGPEGNPVTEAFAALETGMGDGVGVAVAAFCEEVSHASGA